MKGPGPALDGGSGTGVEVGSPLFQTVHLPSQVTEVPRDVVRGFSHNKRVGTYLLGRSLGEGSFAKVKEALHLPTGEKVAVKVIDKKRAKADPYVRKNLRREGRLLQQIRHHHVVQLMEVLETEHSYYLVTEYCAGGDLMDYIAKRKRLEEREVKKFIRQIVSAVDYLHRLGIIHRDLKIENLLLDQNRDIKIIDFGLSNTIKVSSAPEGAAHAQEYLVTQCGSPAYAAPELLNHRKYGLQVDVWSIGVNMYAMLTGSLPFTVDPFHIKTLYNKMVTGQMNPVPDHLSRDGKDILRKFLTADPEKRLSITEALRHPWLSEGRNKPVERPPFPNKLKTSDLDTDILKHMSDNLGYRMSEIIRFVVGNVPSSASATYHLYHRKLQRHLAEQRSQGRAPADTKSVEPTRISLVLQDMTPRVTNPGAPVRALRVRRDSLDAVREMHALQHGPRRSVDKVVRTATASTDKDSVVGKERTFLSSLDHSLEDFRAAVDVKEIKEKGGGGRHHSPATTPSTTPRPNTSLPVSPKPVLSQAVKAALTKPTHHHAGGPPLPSRADQRASTGRHESGGARQLKVTPRPSAGSATVAPSVSASDQHPHLSLGADSSPTRKGRVLIPLSRTFGPLRRGLRGVGGTAASHTDTSPASANHLEKGSSHPRLEAGGGAGRIIRATLPASSAYAHGSSPTPASSASTSRYARQPAVVTKQRPANTQFRSSPHRPEAGGSVNHGGVTARLTPHDAATDVHSKRPVSPQALPLVRRRLAKRSRQDVQGTHAEGTAAERDHDHDLTAEGDSESVTVERLLTSPDHHVSTKTSASQPEGASMAARDEHTLPAISALVTPRH
ncbi:uncharacterized protein LOC143297800 [Babylonia areolata]|uniref:uncharacterized protein LOC143297800 n=1 Tax=Babylonia areolata TaxID=304850 RepID=UPI003FD0A93E